MGVVQLEVDEERGRRRRRSQEVRDLGHDGNCRMLLDCGQVKDILCMRS